MWVVIKFTTPFLLLAVWLTTAKAVSQTIFIFWATCTKIDPKLCAILPAQISQKPLTNRLFCGIISM